MHGLWLCVIFCSAFIDKTDNGDTYSYNPCVAFTDGDCSNVAVSHYDYF